VATRSSPAEAQPNEAPNYKYGNPSLAEKRWQFLPIAIDLRERDDAMPTRNINLTDQLDRFVERQVSSGRYSNASEIVRDALRLLEEREQEREAKLKILRRAAKQGFDEIDQGQGIKLTGAKAISRFVDEVEAEVQSKRSASGG
jgi:antitoxin ParD1/3/4